MKNSLIAIAVALLFSGCTDHRDLYSVAHPLLLIEGDWEPSLQMNDMSMNATANIYTLDNGQLVSKHYFVSPRSVTASLSGGRYHVLLFNGMMYSEQETHLDNIFFRATNQLSTFEAVVMESEGNRRLTKAAGEYIASNEMELLTSMCQPQDISGNSMFQIKYKNGRPVQNDQVEATLLMVPMPVSYRCQVVVNLVNPRSAYVANGSLKGFVGSVFMGARMPSHMDVTHQFRLNDLKINRGSPETGSIHSPLFVTFGPPLDMPNRKYTLELSIILVDGNEYKQTFDITDRIAAIIDKIKINLDTMEPIEVNLTIPIEVSVTLPVVEPADGMVGVGDWEDEEIIKVPIT